MTTKKTLLLLPYFEKSLGKTFGAGTAKKYCDRLKREDSRYFSLTVIATDEKGVYFEAESSESPNTSDNRYHGTTYVDLTSVASVVEAQMIASKQLPRQFDKSDYVA